MEDLGLGDWFDVLNKTGQVAVQAYGSALSSSAQANAAALNAAAARADAQRAFTNDLVLKQTTGFSGLGQNTNLLLFVMLGLAAFFIINQANK